MSPYSEFENNTYEYPNPEFEFEGPAKAAGSPRPPAGCLNPQFPKPPTVPEHELTEGRVFRCQAHKDAYQTLKEVVREAVAMLSHTIEILTKARDEACRGVPTNKLTLDPLTACWLKYKLSVCIDDPTVWTDPSYSSPPASKKTVAEVIRRLMRPRDELAHNQITFICLANCPPGNTAQTTVRDASGACLPGAPRPIVSLCPFFWTDPMKPYRSQTIIHEAVHLTHCAGGIEDRRVAVTIGSAYCVAQFVAATNGKKLDPSESFPCGNSPTCGPVPADLPRGCGAEFGDPSF